MNTGLGNEICMVHNKRNHEGPRKCTLVIHHNLRLRRRLADGLTESGWGVFEAENRIDGLPLMFAVRPDVVFLEAVIGLDESWDTLRSIRLFTSAPVIILAEQSTAAIGQSTEEPESTVHVEPVSTRQVIAIAERMVKSSNGSSATTKRFTRGKTFVAPLRGLTENEVLETDRILRQICDNDDVRLISRGACATIRPGSKQRARL